MEGGAPAPPSGTLAEALSDSRTEQARADIALSSLDAIDAQIHHKIGLLESLLGSCDGVLRRHDADALPSGAPWKGNNPVSVSPPAAAEGAPSVHGRSHSQQTRPHGHAVTRPVDRMVEAARLLRAQRVLCKVTRQLCGMRHAQCCLSSLRIHRLAEKQIRHAVAAEFGRSEVVRGLRLVSWVESAVAQAFLGWHLMVVRRRDGAQERQRILLIADVESQCLRAHVLRTWHRVAQNTLAACGKVQRLTSFLTMRICLRRWVRLSALGRRAANTMRYQQARLWDIKRRSILNAWKRSVREREIRFTRGACDGAFSALSTLRVRGMVGEMFLGWRSLRDCNRSLTQCTRRQSKGVMCLCRLRAWGKLRSVISNWRYKQHYKQRLQLVSVDVKMRCHLRLRRVAFHCWYAVRQEHKVSAQKWWWENKLETLMKTIEAHEQSCSQQERTVQAYLNTSCRLEDKVAELRSNIDNLRSSRVKVRLKYSGFIRMLSFAAWRLYDSVRRQRFHHTQGSGARESDIIGPLEPAQVSDNVQYDSSGVALIAVTFSVWLCALASCQVRRLRAADLGRKVSSSNLQRVVGCWTSHVKRAQRRVKFESIISRRVNLSLSRRVMRCWSGTYFTYSAFLKIRKCRAMNILRRIVQARLVIHWKRWTIFSVHTRHRALVLQRSGRRNRRQLIFKFLGSWYLFSKLQQHRPSGESVLLDASHCLGFPARGQDDDIEDATARLSSRAGIFEQTATFHLLTEKEVELRDLRNQLCMRDENFARLWTALADSESQIAVIQENLSSEMALSEMDQTAALERVEFLAMEKEQAGEMMKGLKASVLQLTEATEALKRDLDNARDQAAEARRELKTCKKDLQEAQMTMDKKNELIDTLRDVSTGAISADVLRDEAHAEIRNTLVKHQSEACLAQLNVELEYVKAQLQARDVTERELRAVLAQRLEGDAVMELREERNVLRSELETLRRDLQASVRELEICKGLVAEPRKSAKMTLEPKKDQELLLEERVAGLNAHLKEKVAEFEARAQAAEEMCNAHLASLERMQSDVKGWQTKAAEHLAAKEEAEAKAAEEISRAEERCQQLITTSQNEGQAQDIAAKQMLQDAENERDKAMKRAESAENELQHTRILYDQAIERAKTAEDDLQQAHQAREEEARKHEKTKAELLLAFDRERAQDEVIRTQKTSSGALESSLLEIKSTSAREAAAKDEVIRKQELKLDEMKMQLNEAKAAAAKEVAAQQSRLTAASDALEKMRKQNVQLEEELDTARLTAARASTERAILQSSINDLSESRRQRENELLDKDEELRKLRREVAGHAALASALEKLRRQNAQLDEELTAVRLKAEDASTEGRLLSSSLCSSTSAKQRIEHELANRSEELFKLQYQISGLSSEHESTQAKLLVSERLCQEQEGRIRALAAELQLVRAQRISDAQHAVPRRQEFVLEFGTRYEDQIHTYTSHIEALKAKIVSVEEDSRRARHERDQAVLREERARNELKRLVNARGNEVGLVQEKEGGVVMSVPNAEHEVERIQALTSEVERLRVELATAQEDALNSRHDRDSALSQNDTTKVESVAEDQVLSWRAVPGPGQEYGRSDYDARVALTAEIQDLRRKLGDVEGGAQEAWSEREIAAQRENRALAELEVLRRQLAEAEGDVQQARSAHNHAVQREKRALAELKKLSDVLQPKENVQTSKQKDDLAPANAGSGSDRSPEEGMRSKLHDANVEGRPSTSLMLNEEVASMNSKLAASKNRRNPVDMVMKLGLNFSAAGEEGSTSRRFFEKSLVQDLANASGMAATNFKVQNMSPGSVIVDVRVFPDAARGLEPEDVVKDLEAQADDAGSQLMNGILTRYTQSLTLSARPGSNSGFQLEQDITSPRGMYSEASQSLGVMTSAELLENSDAEMIQNEGRMAQEMAAQNAQHFVIARENELLVEDRQTLEEKLKVTERELAIKVGQWNELHEQVAQLAKDQNQMSAAAERDASAQAQKLIRLESELADHKVRRQNLEDQLKVAEQMCKQKEQLIHQLQEKLESVQAQISASLAGQRNQVANEGSGAVAGNMLLDPDESLALLAKRHPSNMAANVKTKEPVLQFSKRRDHPEVNVSSVGQMRERQELVASEDSGEDLATFRDNEKDVAELQAKLNECAKEYATALSEKQHTVDNLLRERDVNIKELSDLRASLQGSTLALNATRRQLEHVCSERNTVDLPNTHSELEVAQQHVAELQAKLNTALSEKQHTVDNLLRERDVNIKELSDLRASLQDSTLALNATRRQLEHVCSERNTVDLPNTHSELEVAQQHVAELQAKLNTALSEKQHTVDNLLRERDVNIKELSDLRASLQDSTLALNATRRQLEHVCSERNTVDLPNTHSELEVAQQHVAELQAKLNTALSEKQHTVDNLLRERDVNIKELSDLRASLQDSTLALNATRRQLEHVCSERNTVDLPNTHSELEVAQQHVAELQAKLNTALSEKQHTVDNLLRERDVNIKELSDLRASLQDSTLALNATRRQLEHVCSERNTVDLPNTHSELEVERRWKEALEAGMQADLERKAADTKAAIARTMQTEEWSRILNTLRAQLDAAEAKAAAASARAASMSEIHKIQHSKLSLQSNILQAQKEEAYGRAHAAEKTVVALKNRIATVEREYVETQCQLSDALLQKTDLEANSICGETWGLQSYENLLTDLQSTRAQRDSWKRKAGAWEAGARAETERCKEQETAMQAVASASHTLDETCKQWELVVQDLQAQRDEAEARAAASESRACNLEATIAANTAFLEDLCGQMDTARGDYRQFWACPALGPKVSNQGSDELVANFTAHSQDWESAWNEWRFHADTSRAQTEQKPETAVSSAQDTCNAYLQALRVWTGKVHVLEEARLHWQARAESLTLGRDAASSSESKSQNHEALVRASMAEMKKAQQASVQALVERVYLLEKTCIEWQWNVHNIESQTQSPSSPSHMPGCLAHEMPVRHTLHHLQSRLDSLDTAFQVSTERCQELQVKLNTLCSCIERASGVSEEPFNTSYDRALRTISQLQELQESNDAFSQVAANQHFVDDGWRVAHGDERRRNSSPCCNVNAGIEALEHELLDFQAVFTEVVSTILASEEDMHTHILFLQKIAVVPDMFCDQELAESHNQAGENSIHTEDPQSLNETREGGAVDIAAKGEEEVIGQQTNNGNSLDEPARSEKVDHSQILETNLVAALEQAADFKSKLDAAVELSERCTQENDLMRRRIEECKEDLGATLDQGRLAAEKQREQAESLQRMNVTIETLLQSCNMWEMISVQMTERAENAERQVDEQHSFMLSMSKVVDKLEKSCLWWEALAAEMKDTADVAESHLFDVEKRIESMDDAYRSVWEDRLRWKERAELIAVAKEVAVIDAREELVSDLSSQVIMTQDLQALAQRLMLQKDHLAHQLRLETQTVCKLKGTCAELDNKLHDLIHQNQRLEDVCFEWQVKADSLSAKNVRAESDLTEVQTLLIGASELCTMHEESVRIVANAAKDLVKDNSKLVRADLAQVAAIQSLTDLVQSLEDSCLRWQKVTEEMRMDNESFHQKLLEMATERDEALIDRDEARTEFARVQEKAKRELKEQTLAHSKLTSTIQALAGILESLEQSCSSLASELGPWQANWDVLASEMGSHSKFWQSKLRTAEIERDTAHHVAIQAQEKRAQNEIDIQALRVLVQTLESSCHTWEALVKEMSLSNEAYKRDHMQQLQDACNSEFKSNQAWSRKFELLEQERCKWQIEAEAHGALRDAAASELLLASNEIESLGIVLGTAYLKCQELVAYVGILMKHRERIENLSEAWRERAEQVGREKAALEGAIKRACAHVFDWRRAVAAHQEAALNMEQEAANTERVGQETAEDLDRAQNLFLEEIEQLTKERNSVWERAQEREGAVQSAAEAEEQIQPWFDGAGDMQTMKLQRERDAALERAMAAEEMIQIWQQKMDRLERAWMESRMQVEEMQQQSEKSQQELVSALARAGKPEAATVEKDYLEGLLTTVQRDQKTSQEVHRMQEEYVRSVAFLQKQVRSLKSRLEVDDQASVTSSREQASCSGSTHEGMQQVEALLKQETEACEKQAKAETKSSAGEQVAAFEERSQQLVEENLLLSQRVKNAADCAAGELEAVGIAVLAHVQSLYSDPEHTHVEGNRMGEDFCETLEIMQNRIWSLTAELADVRAQLIGQGPVFEERMEQIEARGAQNVAMQNSLQNAKDEIQQLQSELEHKALALQLEATLTKSAQNSAESLTARMSELQKQNSAMGWALEATQEKCSRQQEKILALEQACDEWRECTHSERAVADVLREALKDSSHASTLDLSLVVQSEALRSSISELRQQFDVLISQKSSAETLCDATLLEGEENGSEDTEHRKYLAGLHYEAEVLLQAFSTCTSELEIVMGGLQVQFRHHEQQAIKSQRELEKLREDLRLRQLEYDEQRLQYKANAEAATRAQIESQEAIFSLQSKLQECEAGNAELQARMNENYDDKILWKYVAEKADRNNAEMQEAQEQVQVRLAKLMEELVMREREAQEALTGQIEWDRIKTELQTELDECREERMQWKSKTEQLRSDVDDLQQENLQLTAENEQARAAQKTRSDEFANKLLECENDRSMWRGKAEQLQQLHSESQESEAQLQAKLAECEADLSLSARKVEAVTLENAEISAQLEAMRLTMQTAQETIPVAVALTLECDYDDTLGDAHDVASFNEGLVTDLHTALGVPKSMVQVLCHQRGSVIAEIVLRSWDDCQGSTLTGQELATRLQDLLSTADGPLRRSPTGCFAKKVDIHGPVAEAVVSAVDSSVQEAARRQEQSKQAERELLARVQDCEYVRQTQNAVLKRQENELNFLLEREDEHLEAMSRAMLELETSLDALETQLHLRVKSEADLQAARLALGNQSIVHYVDTPMKASPEFFTSEEIKHARSRVLMYSVLDIRHARHLQRQCIHMLGVLVRRQECLREVSAMLLKGFYEHVLCNVVIKWRSLKRRQQHRRRIAQNKVEVVTAPLRTRRLLADSFLWWWAIANRPCRLRFFPEPVPLPYARETSRFLPNTLPKSSPRITTPRESLGAVASAGAAMTPRRHPGVDGRSPPSVAGVVIWNLPESAGV